MSTKRLVKPVPTMKSRSRNHLWNTQARILLTVSSVKKLCATIEMSQPVQLIHAELKAAPKYTPLSEGLPFVDDVVDWTDYGMVCRGSSFKSTVRDTDGMHGWHLFSAKELHVHANSCS